MSASPSPFSVVMPAFNAERTLGDSVRSVLAQTRSDLELIIVDDGSTDATWELAEGWAAEDMRVRTIRQRNAGPSAARNTGIAVAAGEYVAFLDSDDLWMPDYAAEMSAALDREPEAGFAHTDAWLFEEANGRIRSSTWHDYYPHPPASASWEEVLLSLLETNFVMSSTTCRADALATVGGYEVGTRSAEDWDLWLRIVSSGRLPVFAPGCLIIGRDRAGSLSKNEAQMWSSMRDVAGRVAANEDLPASVRELARRQVDAYGRGLARVEAGGPTRVARRLVAAGRRLKARHWPGSAWLPAPSPDVAAAFPELASGYGKPVGDLRS